jgi:DNA anti-recombination protein RmuC
MAFLTKGYKMKTKTQKKELRHVISVKDSIYQRMALLAKGFEKPGDVIDKLLTEYEKRGKQDV